MSNHTEYCMIHNDASLDVDALLDMAGDVISMQHNTPITHATIIAVVCLLIANSISQEMEENGDVSLDNAAKILHETLPHIVETILCACNAFVVVKKEA